MPFAFWSELLNAALNLEPFDLGLEGPKGERGGFAAEESLPIVAFLYSEPLSWLPSLPLDLNLLPALD